jgi:hypothetical protein
VGLEFGLECTHPSEVIALGVALVENAKLFVLQPGAGKTVHAALAVEAHGRVGAPFAHRTQIAVGALDAAKAFAALGACLAFRAAVAVCAADTVGAVGAKAALFAARAAGTAKIPRAAIRLCAFRLAFGDQPHKGGQDVVDAVAHALSLPRSRDFDQIAGDSLEFEPRLP